MSTFNPLIPTGLVPLDEDYKNLQLNFQQLDTSFGIDHTKFSVTPLNGYHTVVHLVPFSTVASNGPNNQPVMAPPAVAGIGEIFTAQINDGIATDEAFYYRSGGERLTQLTRNFQPVPANEGNTFLPGGLILNWGNQPLTGASHQTGIITFSQPFPGTVFVFMASLQAAATTTTSQSNTVGNVSSGYITGVGGITGVHWVFNGSNVGSYPFFYWMALGN